jgi:hypothetical protein
MLCFHCFTVLGIVSEMLLFNSDLVPYHLYSPLVDNLLSNSSADGHVLELAHTARVTGQARCLGTTGPES